MVYFSDQFGVQFDTFDMGNEMIGLGCISQLDPLAKPVNDNFNNVLICPLELWAQWRNQINQDSQFYPWAVLRFHKLFHRLSEVDTVGENVHELGENYIFLLLVAKEE